MAPSEAIARLEQGETVGALISAFQADRRISDSIMYVGRYSEYTDAQRAQLLDGLERIAREGGRGDPMTVFKARTAAFTALNTIAREPARQARDVARRLLRIYEQAQASTTKDLALTSLGRILRTSPVESPEIFTLVVSLVKQPVVTRESIYHGIVQHATQPVGPGSALDALIWACDAGLGTLRQLYADREEIEHNDTRERIEVMAANGFDPKSFELLTGWPQPCSDVPPHLQTGAVGASSRFVMPPSAVARGIGIENLEDLQ